MATQLNVSQAQFSTICPPDFVARGRAAILTAN
jgi:hypothetical protein